MPQPPSTIGVCLCTYRRPHDLARCLAGIAAQSKQPHDVLLIVRTTDQSTRDYLAGRPPDHLPLRIVLVEAPGLIAARNAAIDACRTDILAMLDDDAVPHPDWLERIWTHFVHIPQLGGLGGRDRCYNGTSFDERQAPVVGRLQWFGRKIGNHHIGAGGLRDVDVLKGANMSFRADVFRQVRFDVRLRGAGSTPYEDIAFTLAVRRAGWRLMYDPQILVDHYEGPREEPRYYSKSIPVPEAETFRDFAYNGVIALWEELSPVRRAAFLLWSALAGTRVCPGLLQAFRFMPSMGLHSWRRFVLAQQGILRACVALWRGHGERA